MGIPVAKHGNRSVSSSCGSADVLERLGVRIDAPADAARRCLDRAGICFLFAPRYHAGLRFATGVRQALATRTIFNVLGPLVNPARPPVQVLGVYDPALCAPIARTLALLGCEAALVVHGSGLDEIALHGPTRAAVLRDGGVDVVEITPARAGLPHFDLDRLRGGGPGHNADLLEDLLRGRGREPHVACVALNAGALAWIFGAAHSLEAGTSRALDTIRSGRCMDRLELLAEVSRGA
jgi:anthranilate phosphoribosyltransferase